jgi:hypothetical protein
MVEAWVRSMSLARLRNALNAGGVVILLVGLGSGSLIWRAQDRIERENEAAQALHPDDNLPALDSRKHVREVEIYYGKSGVLMEEAEALMQGKPLAKTIGIVSVIAATGLFLAAARLSD